MTDVARLTVYPTSDVHLVLNLAPSPQITLQIVTWKPSTVGRIRGRPEGISVTLGPELDSNKDGFDPTLVHVDLGTVQIDGLIRITPRRVGELYLPLRHVDAEGVLHLLVIRVRVHQKIQRFWTGNTRPTLYAREDDYMLSVFAEFSDGVIGDISGHRYIEFAGTPAGSLETSLDGRVTSPSAGSGAVAVSITDNSGVPVPGPSSPVPVHVEPRLRGSTRLADLIHGDETEFRQRRNLLILGEGFTLADQPLFDRACGRIKHRLLVDRSLTPYHLLGEGLNIWTLFEESVERGASVGHRLDFTDWFGPARGIPLTGEDSDDGGIALPRETRYGLMYGQRPGALRSASWPSVSEFEADDEDDRRETIKNRWHASAPDRQLVWDPRRSTAPYFTKNVFNERFAATIRGPRLLIPADRVPVGAHRWTADDPDFGLVAILVNDHKYGGTNLGAVFNQSLGEQGTFLVHGNTPLLVTKGGPQPGHHLGLVADTFSHELGHALGLGDEYEGHDAEEPGSIPRERANVDAVLNSANLTHITRVQAGSQFAVREGFAPETVKWNWHRIKVSSALVQDAPRQTNPTGYVVEVRAQDRTAWEEVMAANEGVFLRTNLSQFGRRPEVGPLNIVDVTAHSGDASRTNVRVQMLTDTDLVNATSPPGFGVQSLLYVPGDRDLLSPLLQISRPSGPTAATQSWMVVVHAALETRWEQARIAGKHARLIAGNVPLLGPLQIIGISASASPHRITLALELTPESVLHHTTEWPTFAAGSVLYSPRRDAHGNSMTLLDTLIAGHMKDELEGPLYAKEGDCDVNRDTEELEEDVDGFQEPDRADEVIGLYEGGRSYNCDVFRPAGSCRMRANPVSNFFDVRLSRYCFVCSYFIVDNLDPSQHAELDKRYPGKR